jgi:hypothetical protein
MFMFIKCLFIQASAVMPTSAVKRWRFERYVRRTLIAQTMPSAITASASVDQASHQKVSIVIICS